MLTGKTIIILLILLLARYWFSRTRRLACLNKTKEAAALRTI